MAEWNPLTDPFTLEMICESLRDGGIDGVEPEIVDFDVEEDCLYENSVRVMIWLKREVPND